MIQRNPQVLLDDLIFPEGPRWHDGRLWFSDMQAHEVVAVDLTGRRETIATVPQWPSGLGWLPDGRLLVVSMVDRKLLRLEAKGLIEVADLRGLTGFHCNDMVVDAQGRAYIGNFGYNFQNEAPRKANLVLVSPDGSARVVADDLLFPNGMAITPDGQTLIVAETFGGCLTAFDILADGSLTGRRVWAKLPGIAPDGLCLDAEGCIWLAAPSPEPPAFLRVSEGGEIKDRIEVFDRSAVACALGGPERRHLFLIEGIVAPVEEIKRRGRGNGRIRYVEVEVPGAGLP